MNINTFGSAASHHTQAHNDTQSPTASLIGSLWAKSAYTYLHHWPHTQSQETIHTTVDAQNTQLHQKISFH